MPAIPNTWEAYEFKAHLGHIVGGRGKNISQYEKLVLIKLCHLEGVLGILVILLWNLLVLKMWDLLEKLLACNHPTCRGKARFRAWV